MNYDVKVKKNCKRNEKFLIEFEKYMEKNNLSDKTIRTHLSNADFYINHYLNYYDVYKMEDGCSGINMFLGDWFIRKCMWSTAYTIKTTAASVKKFYKCMNELGYVSNENYKFLCKTIKNCMDDWIEKVEDYNNFDDSDFFG